MIKYLGLQQLESSGLEQKEKQEGVSGEEEDTSSPSTGLRYSERRSQEEPGSP